MKLAAILTCHDRKVKTLACLESFFKICPEADVYLTDDGCTDGTSEAISEQFPKVYIIKGDGNLFWARGMFTAWKEAVKGEYDYYLWLNDDVELYPDFMQELMECEVLGGNNCIISGLIVDKESGKVIYGGSDAGKRLLGNMGQLQEITYMHGNVVLIPKVVVRKIGIMDPVLHHDLGDVDYGLTAIENGVKVFTTRKPIALGYPNGYCRIRKWNSSLVRRFKKLYSPLGCNPKLNFYFRKKHFGIINASIYFLFLHILNLLPDFVVNIFWGDAYKDK